MFDPTQHPGLSDDAAALEPAALTAQARLAERLLRVDGGTFTALEAAMQEAWADMVVLQINFQLDHRPALAHLGVGDLQQTYRDAGPVSPPARLIRDTWFADAASFFDSPTAVDGGSWTLYAVYEDES